MIRKTIRLCIAAAAISAILCSCSNNGMTKEFASLKAAAESKSGIIYRTTYFVVNEGIDGMPYPQRQGKDGKYRFVMQDENNKLKVMTGYEFDDARSSYSLTENYYIAPACQNGSWGYVLLDSDAEGEGYSWEIEPQYENAEFFCEQVAAVKIDGKYGFINENGELVVPAIYDSVKFCSFGLIPAGLNGEWYYINSSNERILGPFEDAESYDYGYAAAKRDGKWGFIDKSGSDATAFVYDEVYSVESDGCAWVRTGDKWEHVIVVMDSL